MKFFFILLLVFSIILSIYGGFTLIECLTVAGTITDFGIGYIIGKGILMSIGILIFIFSIRKLKK